MKTIVLKPRCHECKVNPTVPVIRGAGLEGFDPARIKWMCMPHAINTVLPMIPVIWRLDLSDIQLPNTLG